MSPVSPPPAGIGQAPEGLVLGLGLVLPVEAVTETFAELAKPGAGKTYTAAVLVSLRRNGLVTVDGDKVRAADVLFLADHAKAASW